jgi:hypothetical protein
VPRSNDSCGSASRPARTGCSTGAAPIERLVVEGWPSGTVLRCGYPQSRSAKRSDAEYVAFQPGRTCSGDLSATSTSELFSRPPRGPGHADFSRDFPRDNSRVVRRLHAPPTMPVLRTSPAGEARAPPAQVPASQDPRLSGAPAPRIHGLGPDSRTREPPSRGRLQCPTAGPLSMVTERAPDNLAQMRDRPRPRSARIATTDSGDRKCQSARSCHAWRWFGSGVRGSGPWFRFLAVLGALALRVRDRRWSSWPRKSCGCFASSSSRLRALMVRSPAETRPVLASSSAAVPCLVWGRARPRRDR